MRSFCILNNHYDDAPETLREDTDCAICLVAVMTETELGVELPEGELLFVELGDPPSENFTPPGWFLLLCFPPQQYIPVGCIRTAVIVSSRTGFTLTS